MKKIGILGGSFNPAHAGHLHISKIALKRLKLDEIWWLVSPQNPLKSKADMMPFAKRMQSAEKIAGRYSKIKISDLEKKLKTTYTADTLKKLTKKFPSYQFYWLMGADNLLQFTKWKNWQEIIKLSAIHVFDRADCYAEAKICPAYPFVTYHKIKKHPASSTKIRQSFLR